MENFFINPPSEKSYETNTQMSLEEKIQKLINMCAAYKEKYDSMKEDYEKSMTGTIVLEEEKAQLLNEKSHLELKIAQLNEELQFKISEINKLKEMNTELDTITQTAVSRIDKLLSECEFDL